MTCSSCSSTPPLDASTPSPPSTTILTPSSSPSPSRQPRAPPLGDPSLSYLSPKSDFTRLPSATRSPKTVVLLDRSQQRRDVRRGPRKENEQDHGATMVGQRKLSGGRTGALAERAINVVSDTTKQRCVLTNGLAPMLQTDRLALESIVPTYIKSKSINPGGATAATGYTLELTNPLNSTDVYATSEPFEIKAPNSPYPPQNTDSSPSTSDNATSVLVSASASASSSPNGAERHVQFVFGGPLVLGIAAFGWLMATGEHELSPRHWM